MRFFSTLTARQYIYIYYGGCFADDNFICIVFKENVWISIFSDVCFQWYNWQYTSIGSDNGLAPKRQQAIIWTHDCLSNQRIYASLSLNDLLDVQHSPQIPTLKWDCCHNAYFVVTGDTEVVITTVTTISVFIEEHAVEVMELKACMPSLTAAVGFWLCKGT